MRHSRRAVALVASLAALAAVALSWGGCGSSARSASPGAGTGGAAGASGSGALSGSAGTAASTGGGGATGDGGLPYPGAQACKWRGWYRAPQLPKDCMGVCIPDDASKRVDPLVWDDRPDWCPGCKTLATPWGDTTGYKTAVAGGVLGVGQPDVVSFAELRGSTDVLAIEFHPDGGIVAAWREDLTKTCGRETLAFSNGQFGLQIWPNLGNPAYLGDNLFYRFPVSDMANAMVSQTPTFVWPAQFVGLAVPQKVWFNDQLIAEFFAHVALGYPATGEHFYVDQLPGAPGGEWTDAQVVGDLAFVSHYDYKRTDWYTVTPDKKLQLFLGTTERDISALATDGSVIVWKEGRDPVTQSDGSVIYQHYALYSSPYTSDPSKLVPRLLVPSVDKSYGDMHIANGFVEGGYYVQLTPKETAELIVRLSDGRAWISDLPDNMNWCLAMFPGATELWGAVTSTPNIGYGQTLARVPYTAMQVLQDGAPDGGVADAGGQ